MARRSARRGTRSGRRPRQRRRRGDHDSRRHDVRELQRCGVRLGRRSDPLPRTLGEPRSLVPGTRRSCTRPHRAAGNVRALPVRAFRSRPDRLRGPRSIRPWPRRHLERRLARALGRRSRERRPRGRPIATPAHSPVRATSVAGAATASSRRRLGDRSPARTNRSRSRSARSTRSRSMAPGPASCPMEKSPAHTPSGRARSRGDPAAPCAGHGQPRRIQVPADPRIPRPRTATPPASGPRTPRTPAIRCCGPLAAGRG